MGKLTKEYPDGRVEQKTGGQIFGHTKTTGADRFVIVCTRYDDDVTYRLTVSLAESKKLFRALRNFLGDDAPKS